MLTRRHIRIKAMQSLYAFHQSTDKDLDKQEKFLHYSIYQMLDLNALMLQLLVALRDHAAIFLKKNQNKILATTQDKNASQNFVNNKVITAIEVDQQLQTIITNKKLHNWKNDDEYVTLLFNELKETQEYQEYLALKKPNFEQDKNFIVFVYKYIIAPNDKLYDYLEDYRLTWIDDFPLVNTSILKKIQKISEKKNKPIFNSILFKDKDDEDYSLQLLRKVILNEDKLSAAIDGKTPNWDQERIADLDMIILKMGIAEFLFFPSIPVRVTINEYIELAKEYSTPKSSFFINGILDKLVKEFEEAGKINKIGRGLR